jgi:type I restriction enzyme M protein
MARPKKTEKKTKAIASSQSLSSFVKAICDVMRRSNCASALQYVPELTWILFLRILDERETHEADAAEAVGADFTPTLASPYRWQDWAAPGGAKRKALEDGKLGDLFAFLNGELLPHLRKLRDQPGATSRQRVVSELMSGVDRTRIDTERNFRDVLDKVHEIRAEAVELTQERDALQAELARMQNLTRRLSDKYLDLDLLDERARIVLGYLRADEVVIR